MKPSTRAIVPYRKSLLRRIEMKSRKKKLNKGKEARRVARKSGLAPAATRVIPDKRKKPPKHKPNLLGEPLDS